MQSDIKVSVHSHAKVNLEDYIWQFEDKTKMILRPQKAFDELLLTEKEKKQEIDRNNWQPEFLYIHVFSIQGASLAITPVFVEEFQLREKRKAMKENMNNEKSLRNKF